MMKEPTMGKQRKTKTTITIAVGTKNPCKIAAVKASFLEYFPRETHDLCIIPKNVKSGVRDQPFGDNETKLGALNRARAALSQSQSEFSSLDDTQKDDDNDDNRCQQGANTIDFGVGLEGGIEIVSSSSSSNNNKSDDEEKTTYVNKELWCMAYMCVIGTNSEKCLSAKHPDSTYVAVQRKEKGADEQQQQSHHQRQELCGIAKTASFPLPQKISDLVLGEQNMELGDADDYVFGRSNGKQKDGTVGMLSNDKVSRMVYYDHALRLALIPFIWPELYIRE